MSAPKKPPIRVDEVLQIRIEDLAFGGEGIGHIHGFTVFVPHGIPQELVEVRIVQIKDNFGRAKIIRVVESSTDRVLPACPIFEECGGCQWQNLSYSKQLQSKRKFVSDSLERIGHLVGIEVQPCLPSSDVYGYRNKALPVISMRKGHFVAGIYETRTHDLVPYITCPIQQSSINDLIQKTLQKVELAGLTPYQEKNHSGFLRHLSVRYGKGTSELLLAFVTRTEFPEERLNRITLIDEPLDQILVRISSELMEEFPNLKGVIQNINPSRTNIVLGVQQKNLAGRNFYYEMFDQKKWRVSLNSFFQVNTAQAEVLNQIVREALDTPQDHKEWSTVLDLYAGIGTLTLAVADHSKYVIGVEENASAVEDANANAIINNYKNIDFLKGDVLSILKRLKTENIGQIEAIILDPPRKGLGIEVLTQVVSMHPQRIVYVSCDPATLARDLNWLSQNGYQINWVQPLDMFPQTYHVETVVKLTRTNSPDSNPGNSMNLGHISADAEKSGTNLVSLPSNNVTISNQNQNPNETKAVNYFERSIKQAERQSNELLKESVSMQSLWQGNKIRALAQNAIVRLILFSIGMMGIGFCIARAALVHSMIKWSSMHSTTVSDVVATMPSGIFKRYQLIPFKIYIKSKVKMHAMHAFVRVFHDGHSVPIVTGQKRIKLVPNYQKRFFHVNWPIPFNPKAGTYIAQVTLKFPKWKRPRTFESNFSILPLKPWVLPTGFAALTMEGGAQSPVGAVPNLAKHHQESRAAVAQWTKFLGANAFLFLVGQTAIWHRFHPSEFPFSKYDWETAHKYAIAIHKDNLKFGAYLTTFKVVGQGWRQAPYQFAVGYNKNTNRLVETPFISLEDVNRQRDIIHILERLNQAPWVNMIGLDYVRTGYGGYELVDQFVRGLNIPVPAGFFKEYKPERELWLARQILVHHNGRLHALFDWWRAHQVAVVVKHILDVVHPKKPVFAFTLGWDMGHDHGLDPAMLSDAGVGFDNVMLYQSNLREMHYMAHQWPPYLKRSSNMYLIGEMVDFNWVQRSLNPPAPEELYDREVQMFNTWFPMNDHLGMFWHDLYRLIWGVKGPYDTMEWAIAGGAAFSKMREEEGILPLHMKLVIPKRAMVGEPTTFSVQIKNDSTRNFTNLKLYQLKTNGDHYQVLNQLGPFQILSGNILHISNLEFVLPLENNPGRENRYMVAVLLRSPGQIPRDFAFTYVKGVLPQGTPVPIKIQNFQGLNYINPFLEDPSKFPTSN